MKRRTVSVVLSAALVAGCSTSKGPTARATAERVGCEEAVARGVATGKADASMIARTALVYQIGDLKGFMIKDGYRSITVKSQHLDCRPYPLTTGLTLCVATARLCSR